MKKVDFISLLLGLAGGMFFALGMCMCLGAFRLGCDSGSSGHGVAFVPYSAAEGAEMRRWAG